MLITRRNLLHGIGAAGAVIAAGARSVRAFAPNGLKRPLPGAPATGPTLLNRNENAYGPSDRVQAVIREAAAASSRYPRGEYDALRKMLAELHKVKLEQIVLGSGSSEILRMSAAAYLGPNKELLVPDPTYPSLGNYAEANGIQVVRIPLTKMHEHDTDAMLARADSSTGLVYICNPNNPTGTLTPRKNIESFISKLPADVMILIDEAYHHFVSATSSYRSFLDYPLDDPRVVVARTFSKIYGLAGLRVGYSVSSREAASRLSALRLQNGVTIVSAKAAIAALEDSAYVRMAAKRNADDRQEFMNQVNARMLRAIDSHANFVLLNPLRPLSEVLLHLGKNDVHVAPSIPAMERYIRVSLGTPAEMREFWRVWDLMPAANTAM
ncbi:MAG TPA: histidinol-phosphate transaminase [Candidatus Limnocylindria bacterium]|jgi:histidinol-phosphate aminotransferase|nr:histidinol-phosphate transaminase [Candidatus Limnocylindria bacterium]